jgi:hypothetical protein
MYVFMAGVADVDVFKGDQLIASGKTLMESSMSVTVSQEEIRAGKGAKLYGRYFHTSGLALTLTDTMFNMDFIAGNVGAIKTIGANTLHDEEVVAIANDSLTVDLLPTDFLGQGKIGWYAPVGSNDFTKITFTGSTSVAPAVGVVSGQTYCVKYNIYDDAAKEVIINANIIPNEVSIVLKGDLFAGEQMDDSASKVGYVETLIPRFQPNGAFDINMSMTGAANTPFSGVAMAATDGTAGCSNSGYYAKIKEVNLSAHWYDGLTALAVQNAEIDLVTGHTSEDIVVIGVYSNAGNKIIPAAYLTYALDGTAFTLTGNTVNKGTATSGTDDNITIAIATPPVQLAGMKAFAHVTYTT